MRKYVTFAMAAIIMLGMTISVQAQVRQGGGQGPAARNEVRQPERKMITPEKRAEMMAEQLQLTDAEKAKVQALFDKQQAKAKQRQDEMKNNRDEQRAKMDAERKAYETELIKIIGNEKFQQHQAQRIARLENENRKMKMKMRSEGQQKRPYRKPQQTKPGEDVQE